MCTLHIRKNGSTTTNGQAKWLTLQEVRSGTFLIVDMSMRLAWGQYMHLAVKYSVLRIGLPALIHGHWEKKERFAAKPSALEDPCDMICA